MLEDTTIMELWEPWNYGNRPKIFTSRRSKRTKILALLSNIKAYPAWNRYVFMEPTDIGPYEFHWLNIKPKKWLLLVTDKYKPQGDWTKVL